MKKTAWIFWGLFFYSLMLHAGYIKYISNIHQRAGVSYNASCADSEKNRYMVFSYREFEREYCMHKDLIKKAFPLVHEGQPTPNEVQLINHPLTLLLLIEYQLFGAIPNPSEYFKSHPSFEDKDMVRAIPEMIGLAQHLIHESKRKCLRKQIEKNFPDLVLEPQMLGEDNANEISKKPPTKEEEKTEKDAKKLLTKIYKNKGKWRIKWNELAANQKPQIIQYQVYSHEQPQLVEAANMAASLHEYETSPELSQIRIYVREEHHYGYFEKHEDCLSLCDCFFASLVIPCVCCCVGGYKLMRGQKLRSEDGVYSVVYLEPQNPT